MQSSLSFLAFWLISNEFTWGEGNIVDLLSKYSEKTHIDITTLCLHDMKLENSDLCLVLTNFVFTQTLEI